MGKRIVDFMILKLPGLQNSKSVSNSAQTYKYYCLLMQQ